MKAKATFWSLLGPAIWIAVLLLVASDRADGAGQSIEALRPQLEVTAATSAIECPLVVRESHDDFRNGEPVGSV